MTLLLGVRVSEVTWGSGAPTAQRKGLLFLSVTHRVRFSAQKPRGYSGFCSDANSPFLIFREEHFMEHKSLVLHPVTANGDE